MPCLTITAHAKINLALALGQPEPAGTDRAGWHPICSWIHAIGLHDTLHFERLKTGEQSEWQVRWHENAPRKSTLDWTAQQDLAWRALGLLEAHAGRSLPTRITIDKSIPTGSGLGGGSADAAATLVAINRIWELGLTIQTLIELGFGLGSDVPFFLDGKEGGKGDASDGEDCSAGFDAAACSLAPRPAIVEGFGQTLTRCARLSCSVLLMVPRFGCNTSEVYRAFDRAPHTTTPTTTPTTHTTHTTHTTTTIPTATPMIPEKTHSTCPPGHVPRSELIHTLAQASEIAPDQLFNDLSQAARRVNPELGGLIDRAQGLLGCPIHMTGSGSTLFALPSRVDEDVSGMAQSIAAGLPEVVPIQTVLL